MKDVSHHAPLDVLTRPICFAPILLALAAGLSYVYADRTMPIPDEGSLLTNAAKLLRGGVFYRDVDAYTFPGVSYLLAGSMSIFGEHLSTARALTGSFFCAMLLSVYACALALVDQRRAALCGLSLLSLKFLAFPIYTMFFWSDPSLAAGILALAVFLRHRFDGASARLFCVGLLAGLSIVSKQSTGIYVAAVFALVLCFPRFAHGPGRRPGRFGEVVAYGAGLFLVLGSMSAYFASHGLFAEMLHGGLIRPFTGYLTTSGVSFLPPLAWWDFGALRESGPVYFSQLLFELALNTTQPGQAARGVFLGLGEFVARLVYASIPIAFGACAWLWIRAFRVAPAGEGEGETEGDERPLASARFFTAAGVCLGITVSAFPRADFIHVITIYPAVALMLFAITRPALLGQGWTTRPGATLDTQKRRMRIECVAVVLLLLATSVLGIRYDSLLTHRLVIERASLWVKPQHAWLEPLVEYIQEHVPPGEPFFVYGPEAHWYYLSDRYTSRAFSQVYPGMTGDDTGAQLASMLRESRPRVVAQGVLRWPGVPSVPDYTPQFQRALRELYELDPQAIPNPPHPRMLRLWRLRE